MNYEMQAQTYDKVSVVLKFLDFHELFVQQHREAAECLIAFRDIIAEYTRQQLEQDWELIHCDIIQRLRGIAESGGLQQNPCVELDFRVSTDQVDVDPHAEKMRVLAEYKSQSVFEFGNSQIELEKAKIEEEIAQIRSRIIELRNAALREQFAIKIRAPDPIRSLNQADYDLFDQQIEDENLADCIEVPGKKIYLACRVPLHGQPKEQWIWQLHGRSTRPVVLTIRSTQCIKDGTSTDAKYLRWEVDHKWAASPALHRITGANHGVENPSVEVLAPDFRATLMYLMNILTGKQLREGDRIVPIDYTRECQFLNKEFLVYRPVLLDRRGEEFHAQAVRIGWQVGARNQATLADFRLQTGQNTKIIAINLKAKVDVGRRDPNNADFYRISLAQSPHDLSGEPLVSTKSLEFRLCHGKNGLVWRREWLGKRPVIVHKRHSPLSSEKCYQNNARYVTKGVHYSWHYTSIDTPPVAEWMVDEHDCLWFMDRTNPAVPFLYVLLPPENTVPLADLGQICHNDDQLWFRAAPETLVDGLFRPLKEWLPIGPDHRLQPVGHDHRLREEVCQLTGLQLRPAATTTPHEGT